MGNARYNTISEESLAYHVAGTIYVLLKNRKEWVPFDDIRKLVRGYCGKYTLSRALKLLVKHGYAIKSVDLLDTRKTQYMVDPDKDRHIQNKINLVLGGMKRNGENNI